MVFSTDRCILREAIIREVERSKQERFFSNGETETSSMNGGAYPYARGEERPNAGFPLKRRWMKPTSLMEGSRQRHQTGEGVGSRIGIRPFSPAICGCLHASYCFAPYPAERPSSYSRLRARTVVSGLIEGQLIAN